MDFNTNKSKESIWDKKEEEPSVLIEEQKQSMFLQWNTKPSSDYKLKHYNYYTNSPP